MTFQSLFSSRAVLASSMIALSLSLSSVSVQSQERKAGAYVDLGTQGLGVGYAFPINQTVTGRLGGSMFKRSMTVDGSDLTADADFKLQNLGAYADWYPIHGSGFHLTGGLQFGTNDATVKVKPKNVVGLGLDQEQEFTIDGAPFTIKGNNASLNGNIELSKVAPYLGVGYQSRNKGLSLNFNLGLRMSTVKANLKADGLSCSGTAAVCTEFSATTAQLQAALNAEAKKIEDKAKILKTYPVISVGIVYNW